MAPKFSNALSSWTDATRSTVDLTIGDVLDDGLVSDQLGLNGDETVQTSVNGGVFTEASRKTRITEDMEVRFSRSVGTKG